MHVLFDYTSAAARLPGIVSSSRANLSHHYYHGIIHCSSMVYQHFILHRTCCHHLAGSTYWRYCCYCNDEVLWIAGCSSTPTSAGITHLTPQYRMIQHAMAMTMPVTLPPLTSTWPVFICTPQSPRIGSKLCNSRSVVLVALSRSPLAEGACMKLLWQLWYTIHVVTCLQYAKHLS